MQNIGNLGPARGSGHIYGSAHIWDCLDEEMRPAFVYVVRLLFPDLFADFALPTVNLSLSDNISQRICFLLANNPNTSPFLLAALVNHAGPALLERIAEHPRTNVMTLVRLAEHPCPEVRAAVADNPHTPYEVVNRLARDPNPDVRYRLAESYQVCEEVLHILSQDENPFVAMRAQQTMQRLHPEPIMLLVAHPSFDYGLLEAV